MFRRLALATVAVSAGLAQVALAAPPQTAAFSGSATTLELFLQTPTDDPCTVLVTDLTGQDGPRRDVDHYDVLVEVRDICTGENLLRLQTAESARGADAITVAPDLSSVSLQLVSEMDEQGTALGSVTVDLRVSLAAGELQAGRFPSAACLPDATDPETGEPLPDSTFSLYRQQVSGVSVSADLVDVTGELVLILDSGETLHLLTSETVVDGYVDRARTAVLQQLRTGLTAGQCAAWEGRGTH